MNKRVSKARNSKPAKTGTRRWASTKTMPRSSVFKANQSRYALGLPPRTHHTAGHVIDPEAKVEIDSHGGDIALVKQKP